MSAKSKIVMGTPDHVVEDQSEAIAFLADRHTHGGAATERIDTHGAVVVLAGERAYKLKRAVRFPYMDFSTVDLRKRACEAELSLNRRTAPDLYLKVAAIARAPGGGLALGGAGTPVDWVVVMRRFDQDALFDRMARRGALDDGMMTALADEILRFHRGAEPFGDRGGAASIAEVIAGNDEGLGEAGGAVFDKVKVARLRQASERLLSRVAGLLDARGRAGLVRRCHGDLHLGNICLYRGRPTLFDAIEFNDRIACIDALYDLAFLLMDLDHRGLVGLGNLVFNRYFSEGARDRDGDGDGLGDLAGLAALPLFLACRAGVRAQVGAAALAAQADGAKAGALADEVPRYLDLALGYLVPPPPRLVALGGLSGTGKSTLARTLAAAIGPAPGALHLRSDVIRKHMFGKDALDRLGPEAYGPDTTARVYAIMAERAAKALAAGHGVVVDGVHGHGDERAAIEAVAREAGAAFTGLWLDAPQAVLERRVAARSSDASDATVDVLRRQYDYAPGAISWTRLDVSGTAADALTRARAALGLTARNLT